MPAIFSYGANSKEVYLKCAAIILGCVVVVITGFGIHRMIDDSQKESCQGQYKNTACLVKLTAKVKAKEDYNKLLEAIDKTESNNTVP